MPQQILPAEGSVFALARGPDPSGRYVLCIQNLSNNQAKFDLLTAPEIEILIQHGIDSEMLLSPWEARWIAYGGDKAISMLEI